MVSALVPAFFGLLLFGLPIFAALAIYAAGTATALSLTAAPTP